MHSGEKSKGVEFYDLLYGNPEFCVELGQVALASGRLEAELIRLLIRRNVLHTAEGLPLGRLIKIASKNNILSRGTEELLNQACKQRNYLTHNIYALLIDLVGETILERENLIDSDVHTYIDRAWQLKQNLAHLAEIIENK